MTTTIAVDIDGVIYDIIGAMTDRFLDKTHLNYRPKNWDCWHEFGITKDEFFRLYSIVWQDAGANMSYAQDYTNPQAKDFLYDLQDLGYRVSLITKRHNKDVIHTVKYLDMMNFDYDQLVIITDNKGKEDEHFKVIIDDGPQNMPVYIDQIGFLFDQEWNKNYREDLFNVIRIKELKEAIPHIQWFLAQ